MPVRFDDKTNLAVERFIPAQQFEDDVSFKETVMASYRLDNTVGSLLAKESGMPDSIVENPEFNPFDLLTEEEQQDEAFVFNAALADNEYELNQLRKQVARERKDRETLEKSGAMAFPAAIAMGIVDPINLIPVGGTAYRSYKTGSSILAGAMATGSVAAGSAAMSEAALHATQLERTFGESALNVSGSALLGGVLGGLSSGLKQFQMNKISQEIEESMNVEPKVREGLDSVGAARYVEDVEISGKAAKVLAKGLAFDPLTRTLSSEVSVVRRVANSLAENPYDMDGGITQAVESKIKIHDGRYVTAMENHLNNYKEFQREIGGKTGIGRAFNRKGMSRREFSEAVSRQVRNPSENAHPRIKAAADSWLNDFYTPIKNELIEAKLLPEDVDVKTAVNYLNRVWSPGKITANKDLFVSKVAKWLADEDVKLHKAADEAAEELRGLNKQIDELRARGERADKKMLKRLDELEAQIGKSKFKQELDLEELDYRNTAEQIADRIIGTPDGKLPYDFKLDGSSKSAGFATKNQKLKGPLKSRTFNIPDELIEEFLENDIEMLGGRYLRQVVPDLELTKAYGDIDMTEQLKEIESAHREKARGLTGKAADKLEKQKQRDLKDIIGMRDRIRGVYDKADPNNPWVRIRRSIRDLNYLRFMGGVVASSVPDVARIFMAEGFANTFKNGLGVLIKNSKGFKIAAAEAKRYGVGVDAIIGGRSQIIADIADYTQGGTAVERGLRSMAEKFGKVNLMDYWTTGVKQLHAVTMQNTLIEKLIKGRYDKRLARLGIDEADAKLITEQLKKHAEKMDGVWISNAKKWDSIEVEKMWGAAIRKESDRVIVVPGQEKPLFMSSDMGKTVMQFRSFMFSATQRMLIAGIQGQEANYVGGMLMMTSLGIMTYMFKQWDAGRDISDDPMTLVMEGIDRSGALGAIMEINNTIERTSNNNFGLRPLLGVSQPASRFASRSQAEALLGPTFGSFLSTVLQVTSAGTDANEWKEGDTRAIRRLIPYQNLMIIRQWLDKIEQSIQ